MKCTKCGSDLKEEAKFCGECGERVVEDKPLVGEVNVSSNKNFIESKNVESVTETMTGTKNSLKKYIKPLAILVVVLGIIVAVTNHKSDKKLVYELIPGILYDFECGLGYEEPVFPEFKSDNMIITDLDYTRYESGDTYEIFYVDGIVTITTAFGNQIDLDYRMLVGLDEEYKSTGKWWAQIIDGDVFEW